jgi:type 2 lantibiotic biosynthesis protein LanM
MTERFGRTSAWWLLALTPQERVRPNLGDSADPAAFPEPDWLVLLRRAYDYGGSSPTVTPVGSSGLLEPLVRCAVRDAVALAAAETDPGAATRTIELFSAALADRLREAVTPAFLLELNIARLEGRLAGATPEQRYRAFSASLADPASAEGFFSTYPVLARLTATMVAGWSVAAAELAVRLENDQPLLERDLVGTELGALVGMEGGRGDAHNGGRAVSILVFAHGHRVVYKPRSLGVDVQFQRLLDWLSDAAPHIDLRRLRVLDRGDYGWTEFVAQRPVTDRAGAARYYRRTGYLLGLMYALRADDLHYENLIAAGEHPVVVDLETLFAPTPRAVVEDPRARFWAQVGPSVLATGLLPNPVFGSDERSGVDVSGLGGRPGQIGARSWPALVGAGTDSAHREWTLQPLTGAENEVVLDGVALRAREFADEIVAGFTETLGVLASRRQQWCADDGVLAGFGSTQIRLIARPTMQYAVTMQVLWHPDHLYDAADLPKVTERLYPGPWGTGTPRALVDSEVEQLLRGDVPYFLARPDSTDLWSPDGSHQAGVLAAAPLAQARERVEKLDGARHMRETWTIRSALFLPELNGEPLRFPTHELPDRAAPDPRDLLDAAAAIGDRLLDLAIGAAGELRWQTVSSVAGRNWAVRDTDPDLYEGAAGVALFLGYLGVLTGRSRYLDAARVATETALSRADDLDRRGMGAFTGLAGLAYLADHAAGWALSGDFRSRAGVLARRAFERATDADDPATDVIGGLAGLVMCLLAVRRNAPAAIPLDWAASAGDMLLRSARPLHGGLGWPRGAAAALTGFAHGSAGIAVALAALGVATGDAGYLDAAEAAARFERHWFSPRVRNWPDLRAIPELEELADPADGRVYLNTWCHGAPGIGLGRASLLMAGCLDDDLRTDLVRAVESTLARGFGGSHSLCHGDLGNLETLLAAAGVLVDPDLHASILERRAAVFNSVLDGPVCGTPHGLEVPGLMTGLAGIGYGLLRAVDPSRVPNVLLLHGAVQ